MENYCCGMARVEGPKLGFLDHHTLLKVRFNAVKINIQGGNNSYTGEKRTAASQPLS